MRLSSLIAWNKELTLRGNDINITNITADSRQVQPGTLFFAIPGAKHDGRQFISEALQQGASAIVTPAPLVLAPSITQVIAPDIRAAMAGIAATFFGQQPETIVAVTGTSGKTSTAQFTRELWTGLGCKSGSIGTLGLVTEEESRYGSLTTPDSITLHQMLHEVASKGVSHLAMEASSHGITLNRLEYVRLKAAGFTNLSRDHLDYHETMENYLNAKLRLFSELLPAGGTAVINADSDVFEKVAAAAIGHSVKVISYGKKSKDIRLISATPKTEGQVLSLDVLGTKREVMFPILGGFQAYNILCALGLVIATGSPVDAAIDAIASVSGVPGRLQLAGFTKTGGAVFVDYAHKPDALENVLQAMRPHVAAHKNARLSVVFGCGGNRDKGKRPIMGEIATRLADRVVVTDDNPRNEDPATIRAEVLAGCNDDHKVVEVGDREEAIKKAIHELADHDVLIIAGKGHESGQIIGTTVHPFDDLEIAKNVLQNQSASA